MKIKKDFYSKPKQNYHCANRHCRFHKVNLPNNWYTKALPIEPNLKAYNYEKPTSKGSYETWEVTFEAWRRGNLTFYLCNQCSEFANAILGNTK